MNLFEASKFYGDYRLLCEIYRADLSENAPATIPHEKILTCHESSNDSIMYSLSRESKAVNQENKF